MSKRNFILLIIALAALAVIILGFFFLRQPANPTGPGGTGTNFFSPFNPFGSGGNNPNTTPPTDVSGYVPPPEDVVVNDKLKKVSTMPIAGFTVYPKERIKDPQPIQDPTKKTKSSVPLTEFVPALRYVARVTGNIYETFADKIDEKKFSSTIIPQVYEAFFGNKGNSVVMRYLKNYSETIQTFLGALPPELLGTEVTGSVDVKGTFLPDNVEDISVSPDASSIFYLFKNKNVGTENMIGTTLNLATGKRVQILNSPFTEWLSGWPTSRMVTVTTKPSSGIPGYAYAIDPTNSAKTMVKILGGVNGLTTLTSPNGKFILYGNDKLGLNVLQIDTKSEAVLGVKTMPEKCVWVSGSDAVYCAVPRFIDPMSYPDSWYKGQTSFSDQFWKVDVKTGNATMIFDPLAIVGGENIDGIKLALDSSEGYLFFVNKKDSFLWEYALK